MYETTFNTTNLNRIVFIPAALNKCSILYCMFIHLTRDVLKGSAIFIERDDLNLEISCTYFSKCVAVHQGGSIFLNGDIHSNFTDNCFFDCKSQQGLVAYINKGIVEIDSCAIMPDVSITGSQEFTLIFNKCKLCVNDMNITRNYIKNSALSINCPEYLIKNSVFYKLKSNDHHFHINSNENDSNLFNHCFFINLTEGNCFYSTCPIQITESTFDTVKLTNNIYNITIKNCNVFNCSTDNGIIFENCTNHNNSHLEFDNHFFLSYVRKEIANETYISYGKPITSNLKYSSLIIEQCSFINITNNVHFGTCVLCRDSIREISITNSLFYQIHNIYGFEVSPSTIYISYYLGDLDMNSNCYCDSIGAFLVYQSLMKTTFLNQINQTTTINLKTDDCWDIYTIEIESIRVDLININVSNQLQPILHSDHFLTSRFSVFYNNTIQFSPISFQIYIGNDAKFKNNCLNSLRFTKFDERKIYSIIYSERNSVYFRFYENFVSGIDENTYLLNVDQLFLENNTFQNGIKVLCDVLYINESNVYTQNVDFPSFDFVNCKLPVQKISVYIIVLISIGTILLISIFVLISMLLYKKRKIRKAESKLTLKTSIVNDFG